MIYLEYMKREKKQKKGGIKYFCSNILCFLFFMQWFRCETVTIRSISPGLHIYNFILLLYCCISNMIFNCILSSTFLIWCFTPYENVHLRQSVFLPISEEVYAGHFRQQSGTTDWLRVQTCHLQWGI